MCSKNKFALAVVAALLLIVSGAVLLHFAPSDAGKPETGHAAPLMMFTSVYASLVAVFVSVRRRRRQKNG